MRPILCIAILFCCTHLHASQKVDSTQNIWQVHGFIQLNNNGISPVPAFSLGKPSLMTTLAITKNRFIYGPEVNYGFDGLPWTVNSWFRYRSKEKNNNTYGAGTGLSFFFTRDEKMANSKGSYNQYLPFELFFSHNFSDKNSLSLTYWHSNGLDSGSVKSGHFVILSAGFSKIKVSRSIKMDLRPNLFYIANEIPFKGFFGSIMLNIYPNKSPLSLFSQVVQPFWLEGTSDFNYNFGLNFNF
ncbi:MAG: hypothetical protein V4683_08555 [Bacteroidota bacterium]